MITPTSVAELTLAHPTTPGLDHSAPAEASLPTQAPAETALARIDHLDVSFTDRRGHTRQVVFDVSLHVEPGECLAVIGESGSGKSVSARTLIGLTGRGATVTADRLELHGRDVSGLSDRQWQRVRGAEVGFILQDALVALDPLRTVGQEIEESLRLHGVRGRAERRRRAIALLDQVGVPEPALRAGQRPDELSGGLRQRALIASAIALNPPLVVADEPTTALDVSVQAQVLDLLAQRKAEGTGIILISHDFSVVGRLADRVAVMQGGRIVEQGTTEEILSRPRHEYTRRLLDALPSGSTRGSYLTPEARLRAVERAEAAREAQAGDATVVASGEQAEPKEPRTGISVAQAVEPLLVANNLVRSFRGPDGTHRTVVRDVSFEILPGQTVGIVGESGSGKSTTASIALGLLAPDSGVVTFQGQPWSELSVQQRRPRRRRMTVVYQDPLSSFDPRWNGERILTDALDRGGRSTAELRARAAELAELVGLHPAHLAKNPLQLSGGQRQRLAIARALAPEPDLVVLDEAVSALDVSVQAQVLDLLTELQERLGTAYLFISHDLGVIHHMSDSILVMKDGQVVEHGDAEQVFTAPQHPYTQSLVASLDVLSAGQLLAADTLIPTSH